jgi:hypothetical protein
MRTRPHTSIAFLTVLIGTLSLAACSSTNPTAPPAPSAALTAAPSGGASAPAESAVDGSQTDTEWGRIWDDVPAGFPTYPGSTIADDTGPDPASATYAVAGRGDPAEIASWMQAALETATFSTEALSGPLEDGSFVLDSVGDGDCRIQVVVAPMGGLTFVTVRYGAACPAA